MKVNVAIKSKYNTKLLLNVLTVNSILVIGILAGSAASAMTLTLPASCSSLGQSLKISMICSSPVPVAGKSTYLIMGKQTAQVSAVDAYGIPAFTTVMKVSANAQACQVETSYSTNSLMTDAQIVLHQQSTGTALKQNAEMARVSGFSVSKQAGFRLKTYPTSAGVADAGYVCRLTQ